MQVSSPQDYLTQLPAELIAKVLNRSRLRNLQQFAQTCKKGSASVKEIKVNLNSSSLSVEASPPGVESAATSSPSWESLIVSVQSQLAISKIAVHNLSADDIIKNLTIKEVVKDSGYLQQPIGFSERKELIKESQENLSQKYH